MDGLSVCLPMFNACIKRNSSLWMFCSFISWTNWIIFSSFVLNNYLSGLKANRKGFFPYHNSFFSNSTLLECSINEYDKLGFTESRRFRMLFTYFPALSLTNKVTNIEWSYHSTDLKLQRSIVYLKEGRWLISPAPPAACWSILQQDTETSNSLVGTLHGNLCHLCLNVCVWMNF